MMGAHFGGWLELIPPINAIRIRTLGPCIWAKICFKNSVWLQGFKFSSFTKVIFYAKIRRVLPSSYINKIVLGSFTINISYPGCRRSANFLIFGF